jgi:hypothetical protein
VILLAHLHNGLVENPSAGMPLAPAAYAALFDGLDVVMLADRAHVDPATGRATLDLRAGVPPDALAAEPAVTLVATRLPGTRRRFTAPAGGDEGHLGINPLYDVARAPDGALLRLRFPSRDYEEEFRSGLPRTVTVSDRVLADIERDLATPEIAELANRRVLLRLPASYV